MIVVAAVPPGADRQESRGGARAPDDFKAKFVKFGQDAKDAESSVKDLDSFKAAFTNIGKNDCGGCHEVYRLKKS